MLSGAQTVSAEFVAVLDTFDMVRTYGWSVITSLRFAARLHMIDFKTAKALHVARELRELERLALLAESQNLSALLRRQGN